MPAVAGRFSNAAPYGIALELQLAAVARVELVLVELAGAELGHEQLPDARAAAHAHRVIAPVPVIERADDADALGVRRPDREADAAHAGDRALVSAEEAVRVDVAAARESCEVVFVDLERERVRIVALVPAAVLRLAANAIRRRDAAARSPSTRTAPCRARARARRPARRDGRAARSAAARARSRSSAPAAWTPSTRRGSCSRPCSNRSMSGSRGVPALTKRSLGGVIRADLG